MGSVRVLFTRRHHPGSVAIRAATWSAWSHVDLVDDLGTAPVLIGAIALKGVVAESLERRLTLASRAALVKFPAANPAAVIAAARSQLGKPYDWSGIAGLVARNRDWQEDDSWFCSELVPWALGLRPERIADIPPRHGRTHHTATPMDARPPIPAARTATGVIEFDVREGGQFSCSSTRTDRQPAVQACKPAKALPLSRERGKPI